MLSVRDRSLLGLGQKRPEPRVYVPFAAFLQFPHKITPFLCVTLQRKKSTLHPKIPPPPKRTMFVLPCVFSLTKPGIRPRLAHNYHVILKLWPRSGDWIPRTLCRLFRDFSDSLGPGVQTGQFSLLKGHYFPLFQSRTRDEKQSDPSESPYRPLPESSMAWIAAPLRRCMRAPQSFRFQIWVERKSDSPYTRTS